MGIWDRLGNVIRSCFNGEDEKISGGARRSSAEDPDLAAAFDELDDYLNTGKTAGAAGPQTGGRYAKPIPEELRPDFAELEVPFGASPGDCKAAYKKLLKTHHPDRHAGHPGNFSKATDKTARINAAYDRIEKWREGSV